MQLSVCGMPHIVGCFSHKSGASGAAAMSQTLVIMPPESDISSTLVATPCVQARQLGNRFLKAEK